MKHTPGPWTRTAGERFKHDQSAGIKGPNGMYIACALDMNRTDKDSEVEANAILISAVPEMAEAIQWMIPTFEEMERLDVLNEAQRIALEFARSALQKAGLNP